MRKENGKTERERERRKKRGKVERGAKNRKEVKKERNRERGETKTRLKSGASGGPLYYSLLHSGYVPGCVRVCIGPRTPVEPICPSHQRLPTFLSSPAIMLRTRVNTVSPISNHHPSNPAGMAIKSFDRKNLGCFFFFFFFPSFLLLFAQRQRRRKSIMDRLSIKEFGRFFLFLYT